MQKTLPRALTTGALLALAASLATPDLAMSKRRDSSVGRRAYKSAVSGTTRLTPKEQALAQTIAEQAIATNELATDDRLYLVSVKWFHDKSSTDQKALVTHYRTDGDLTIRHRVNLTKGTLEHESLREHSATALSKPEFELAKQLALADPKVQKALGKRRDLVIEPMVVHGAPEGDPLHGHRVVRLLFKTGYAYLSRPVVFVDLTDGRVIIEARAPETVQ